MSVGECMNDRTEKTTAMVNLNFTTNLHFVYLGFMTYTDISPLIFATLKMC